MEFWKQLIPRIIPLVLGLLFIVAFSKEIRKLQEESAYSNYMEQLEPLLKGQAVQAIEVYDTDNHLLYKKDGLNTDQVVEDTQLRNLIVKSEFVLVKENTAYYRIRR